MKNIFYFIIKNVSGIVIAITCFLWAGCGCGDSSTGSHTIPPCSPDPDVIIYHQPFYPKSHEAVTFSLKRMNTDLIESVALHVSTQVLNAEGVFEPATLTIDNTWDEAAIAALTSDLNFAKTDGFEGSQLITYQFTIKPKGCTTTITQEVTFATDPYPLLHHPIPGYVTGDISTSLNVLFCPDVSLFGLTPPQPDLFTFSVGDNIITAMLNDPYIRSHRDLLNFYFTNEAGHVSRGAGDMHALPTDLDLTGAFIQSFMILHSDTTDEGLHYLDATYLAYNISSSGFCEKGTLVHEFGHSLYGLADEYANMGGNFNNPDKPNNWPRQADAAGVASLYDKTSADAVNFIPPPDGYSYWKLCDGSSAACQMKRSGMTPIEFDTPCQWAMYASHYKREFGTYPSH